MRLTAKEVAERLDISYVVASGLMTHLEDVGKAKVVEKRFHVSGKGKPTRIYEVDQHTVIDFGEDIAKPEVVTEVVENEVFEDASQEIVTQDHVEAALARLTADAA